MSVALEIRVVKLGGSLLDLPDLGQRVEAWLSSQSPACNLMIVGGGEIVEQIRNLDNVHGFDPSDVHWLCVDLLTTSAHLAAKLLNGFYLIEERESFERILASRFDRSSQIQVIVLPRIFYSRQLASSGCDWCQLLPQSWATTTDSIAALLARQVQARELVLLKSNAISESILGNQAWADRGIVDKAFPEIAETISSIRMVNLRDRRWCLRPTL